jgi:hypothetical protein
VLPRAVIACLFALVLVGPSSAAPQELIPGLTCDRKVEFTTRGPVVVNVLTVPRPGGLWSLKPALSNEAILGTERLTAIERRLSTTVTVAGVNGDLTSASGAPSGIVMRNGALDQPSLPGRSSIGFDASGTLTSPATAVALDGGASSAMAFDEKLLSRPSGPSARSATRWSLPTEASRPDADRPAAEAPAGRNLRADAGGDDRAADRDRFRRPPPHVAQDPRRAR